MDSTTQKADQLRAAGLRTLTGVISDSGGVLRAKSVPAARVESFARNGMGASLTWPVFTIDNGVAVTELIGVAGDLRLTADLDTAVVLDGGLGWAVADVRDQEGNISPYCWRDVTRRQVDALAAMGIETLVGHEMEFTILDEEGLALGARDGWAAYGVGPYLALGEFAAEVTETLAAHDIPVEQIHAEYGVGQFELSLPPRDPMTAGANVLLARTVISQIAAGFGLKVSFSPVPFTGGAGNGAHLHVSLTKNGQPLLNGGPGVGVAGTEGMHPEAAAAIAGVVEHLPGTMAVLAGSVVSGERMQPGHWSGAWTAWGVENREAAVRILVAGLGNPHGANIEVKCVDASANTWLATGLILGMMRHGIEHSLVPPAEVPGDPSLLSDEERAALGVRALPWQPEERVALFADDPVVKEILGEPMHHALLAVRRYELTCLQGQDIHAATRYSWSG